MSIAYEPNPTTTCTNQVLLELRVVLNPEEDGTYSAIARDLPGVASQGGSLEEALANIREAFIGAFEDYQALSKPIPWRMNDCEIPPGAIERWILIDG